MWANLTACNPWGLQHKGNFKNFCKGFSMELLRIRVSAGDPLKYPWGWYTSIEFQPLPDPPLILSTGLSVRALGRAHAFPHIHSFWESASQPSAPEGGAEPSPCRVFYPVKSTAPSPASMPFPWSRRRESF